jgi:hypothetical protein
MRVNWREVFDGRWVSMLYYRRLLSPPGASSSSPNETGGAPTSINNVPPVLLGPGGDYRYGYWPQTGDNNASM